MAVSKPDFTRQFGSAKTDLTPISNANYLQGWDYVGSTPPTKNDFTYLQYLSDQRTIWLFENYGAGRLLNIQVLTANGTYTKTAGTNKIRVRGVGGGGAGGGVGATSATSTVRGGGGGGAGTYGELFLTTVPASVAVTIGNAGAGILGGGGGNGGATSFGSLLILPGGNGGDLGLTISTAARSAGGGGYASSATGAQVFVTGAKGGDSYSVSATTIVCGLGANSPLGSSGNIFVATNSTNTAFTNPGMGATGYGAGGGGASCGNGGAANTGGNGSQGILIIEEYA